MATKLIVHFDVFQNFLQTRSCVVWFRLPWMEEAYIDTIIRYSPEVLREFELDLGSDIALWCCLSLSLSCFRLSSCLGSGILLVRCERIGELLYCSGASLLLRHLLVRVFLEYLATDLLKFARTPGPSGDRGAMPLMAAWGWLRGMPPAVRRKSDIPLVPVQRWSIELPATTVGEWRRRHSLQRHKGGLWTVPLIPATTFCCRVAFKSQAYEDQTVSGHAHVEKAPFGASRPRVTS